MSTCFQAGKRRADQRLARCGSTSTATTTKIRQHDALALISRVGIGAIFFLSGCTKVEGRLISLCCCWRLAHGSGAGQRGIACCVTRDRPGAGWQAAGWIGFYLLLF